MHPPYPVHQMAHEGSAVGPQVPVGSTAGLTLQHHTDLAEDCSGSEVVADGCPPDLWPAILPPPPKLVTDMSLLGWGLVICGRWRSEASGFQQKLTPYQHDGAAGPKSLPDAYQRKAGLGSHGEYYRHVELKQAG